MFWVARWACTCFSLYWYFLQVAAESTAAPQFSTAHGAIERELPAPPALVVPVVLKTATQALVPSPSFPSTRVVAASTNSTRDALAANVAVPEMTSSPTESKTLSPTSPISVSPRKHLLLKTPGGVNTAAPARRATPSTNKK